MIRRAVATLGQRRDPTPEEIAERAAAIRATWSPREEARRRGVDLRAPGWLPDVFPGGEIEVDGASLG